MSPARSTARHARLHEATRFQVESLERRVLLSTAIAAFGAQQTFAVGSQPRAVAVADVNVDGKPDLIVANAVSNTVSVLLGNGNGRFQNQLTYATGASPFAVAVADVNGDGKPDLIVADSGSNSVSVLLGTGNGTFQNQLTFATGAGPRSLAIADLNGDGKPDIVVGDYSANAVSVLLGNGNGTFQPQQTYATGSQPRSIAIADVNIDGKPDLIVANHGSNSVSVLLNSGTGTFLTQQTYATGTSPFSVATADVNRDGKPDILVANNGSNSVSVLLNTGTGAFQPQQTFAAGSGPIAIDASDINGDGKPDLVVANYNGNSASVLLGNGDGTFQSQKTFAVGAGPRSIAVADINDNGREDLIVGNSAANSVSVLLGDVPPTVLSINRTSPSGPSTNDSTLIFTVTFNEPVTGVDPADFVIPRTGPVSANTPVVVNGSGAVYTVTVTGVSGYGTLELDLVDDGIIQDAAGNPLQPAGAAAFQTGSAMATENAPFSVTAGDVNGDGIPDLVTANFSSNSVSVLLGNGNGTFLFNKTFGTGSGPRAVAIGDVNGDGKPDLVVTNFFSPYASVLIGNGDGTFATQRSFATGMLVSAKLADVNGDGKLDLVGTAGSDVEVLLGNGNGTFQAPRDFSGAINNQSAVVADVNGDGKPDVVVVSPGGVVAVLLGNGDGTFQAPLTFAAAGNPTGVAVADLNGDGRLDLITVGSNAGSILLGNGNGTFLPQQTFTAAPYASAVVAADVNGDGKPDVIVANGTPSSYGVQVFLGNGDGTLRPPTSFLPAFGADSVAVLDSNLDGRVDIAAAGGGAPGSVHLLTGNTSGNFAGQVYTILPPADTITGTSGDDSITLTRATDGTDIDWTLGTSSGQLPINDLNGLTINGNGGNDTITLDYTNGNPLPNKVHLNGTFTINGLQGTNPLASTTLEIGKSTVLITYSSSDPMAVIQGYLQTGYNAGGWNGTPIATTGVITSAAAQANNGYMIGYADSADGTGVNTTPNTIELKYTLGGDLNLTGTVNFSDFALVVANYGKAESWDGGAITYGATVSFADFALTVANYGKQAVTSAALAASAVNAAALPSSKHSNDSSPQLLPAIQATGASDPATNREQPLKPRVSKRRLISLAKR